MKTLVLALAVAVAGCSLDSGEPSSADGDTGDDQVTIVIGQSSSVRINGRAVARTSGDGDSAAMLSVDCAAALQSPNVRINGEPAATLPADRDAVCRALAAQVSANVMIGE